MKKILIISNNPLDIMGANGKTLESFFKNFDQSNIAQLFLNEETPNSKICNHFYHINEKDIIKKILKKKDSCGGIVGKVSYGCGEEQTENRGMRIKIPKNNITRLFREGIWKTNLWQDNQLRKWVLDFNPDLIFFCAGDSGFAYDIVFYIHKLTKAKLVTYITDDYILPQFNFSILFWIRRNLILKKMSKMVDMSDRFMTISEPMRCKYLDIFHKDSFVASNMCEDLRQSHMQFSKNEIIKIVYTGGLHYGRDKVLIMVGNALQRYNREHKCKVILNIYTPTVLEMRVKNSINIENGSQYCGSLNLDELKNVLNNCDFPLHVESFKKKNIYKTKLSVSTKITEYLSLGKCILAIGPKEVASLRLLSETAYCINSPEDIYALLKEILENNELSQLYAEKALNAFSNRFNSTSVRRKFEEFISEI